MLERIVLIVDDNKNIESVYIPAYKSEISKMDLGKWADYKFTFIHKSSMKEAQEYLSDIQNCVDVLVVDYDFGGEKTFPNGADFVKYVRESVNRYCQIVFYTMQGIDSIDKRELVDLVNSDVFQLVDKSSGNDIMAKAIFAAATRCNPIVESIERFYLGHSHLLSTYRYTVFEEKTTFDDIINHIRMDDKIGRQFVEKLLNKAVLQSVDLRR
ncbi:MAG: hypothetical protein IK108_10120 [Clostridia bacterium]|nr:hypothetical protein [Clostridia bacterium]